MVTRLTIDDKQRINAAIQHAEVRTNGEIVTVITQRCDDYLFIPTLWAALFALSIPGLVALYNGLFNTWAPIEWNLYLWQCIGFVACFSLTRWPGLAVKLIPKEIKNARCSRRAHELFFIEGLHLTEEHTGIMLFVSEAERYVEVIADHGINSKVNTPVWQDIVDTFTAHVRRGETVEGYLAAITAMGELLATHYPIGDNDKNPDELPNHLIEL